MFLTRRESKGQVYYAIYVREKFITNFHYSQKLYFGCSGIKF